MAKSSHPLERGDVMVALLLDMDGVLYEGEYAVPGASEAVFWLRAQRVPHLFLTNTTSRPRSALVEKLAGLGIRVDRDSILTPAVAAAEWLRTHAPGPAALFVPEATVSDFEALPQLPREVTGGAASVVIGDLGSAWDFDTLNRAFRLLMDDPRPVLVARRLVGEKSCPLRIAFIGISTTTTSTIKSSTTIPRRPRSKPDCGRTCRRERWRNVSCSKTKASYECPMSISRGAITRISFTSRERPSAS